MKGNEFSLWKIDARMAEELEIMKEHASNYNLNMGGKYNMAKKDGTGPRSGSTGPRDGRGTGRKGTGRKTGGKKGTCK